ncbi:MAG: hypothetical protein Q7T16_02075 [Candidatus Burarchaeum sp.]|nr:hypothetical protein [Candidatus Burarchaeum sp.]MDO8339421.1 hypothetical protein [Candidatus Burarchaeum sp.]
MAEQKSASKGDGVFITAVVLLVAAMLFTLGFGGLGSAAYSPFAILLLVGAGGATYFVLKDAGEFGVKGSESALLMASLALMAAFSFIIVFARSYPVLSSIAAAVVIACAAPIIGLAVRNRAGAKAGPQEVSASS